jgi:hypothetical protein
VELMRVLDELDRVQKLLEEEFPECKIGYAYRPGQVTWTAQLGPALSADSPDALRDVIKRAYVEVTEKISERTRGTASAATGDQSELTAARHAKPPVTEP